MLRLPNSTASVLRQASNLSTLREALEHAGMAESVYDTNAHVGQTLLAPTNKAFEKLGSKVNHFLFSPWGRPYLQALLKGHIVGNRTVFSDVTFPHDGAAQMIDVRTMITAAQDGTAEVSFPCSSLVFIWVFCLFRVFLQATLLITILSHHRAIVIFTITIIPFTITITIIIIRSSSVDLITRDWRNYPTPLTCSFIGFLPFASPSSHSRRRLKDVPSTPLPLPLSRTRPARKPPSLNI